MAAKRKSTAAEVVRTDQTPAELEAERRQHDAARAFGNLSASKLDLAFECLHWTTLALPEDKTGRSAEIMGNPFHEGAANGIPTPLEDEHEDWLGLQRFDGWLEKGRKLLPSTFREEVAYCLHPDGKVTRLGEKLGREYGTQIGICGTLDVDGSASPESEVDDYKTGKRLKPAKDAWQLRFACVVTGASKRAFHYVDENGEVTPDSYVCTAAEREDDRVRLVVLMGDILGGRTDPKPGPHCTEPYCPAQKAKPCPAYEDHRLQKGKPMGRMSLNNVTSGRVQTPRRVLVYGVEGIGKSTFGAGAPKPIFLDPDDGTSELDVARFPKPETWADCIESLDELANGKHDFQTFVLDTADALEVLVHREVCRAGNKKGIEDFGFGKGYVAAVELVRQFIERLDKLHARGMHVVTLAHAHVKSFQNPAGDNYDRFQLKMHDKFAAVFREWHKAVLFAAYQTFLVKEDKHQKAKAVGDGSRVLYTEHRPAWSAKNRYGLPFELPLDWDSFEEAARKGQPVAVDVLKADVSELIDRLPEDKKTTAGESLARCGDDARKLSLLANWIKKTLEQGATEAA